MFCSCRPGNTDDSLVSKKISIVGCGQVGLAAAYAILNQEICDHLALVDIDEKKLDGEVKDFRQASAFSTNRFCTVDGSKDFFITKDSDFVIVTAGAKQKPGQSRLGLLNLNVKIMKSIMGQLLKYSPHAPICIVSNPCDIIAAIANKIAMKDENFSISSGQIFGSGTVLDTGRLHQMLAVRLNYNIQDLSGYVIGEHGDSSVVLWSSVKIKDGVALLKSNQEPGENEINIHKDVVRAAEDVIERKGYTNWAVGMACAKISKAVLENSKSIMPVSTSVKGYTGIKEDVFLSVPCVVGSNGVGRCSEIHMTDSEMKKFRHSVSTIWNAQKDIWNDI